MAACQPTRAAIIAVFLQLICIKICLTAECNYVISSESETGWFTSPNYPDNYSDRANCSWLIHTKFPIIISFTHFHTEPIYDLLKIYDGPTRLSPLLLEASEDSIPPSIVSITNQTLITFTSDESFSFSGFNATYSPFRCQEMLSDSGWFTSPNYPLNYPDNSRNCWVIKATNPIMLSFTSFHLEENSDWLTIYNGLSTEVEVIKLSSNKTIQELIIPGTNEVLITFSSGGTKSFSGFEANYSPSRCQAISLTDSGWFTTPNYPKNYYDNLTLCWSINSTTPIKLWFNHVDLEENRGLFKIYDGSATNPKNLLLETSSSTKIIKDWIFSTSNQMLVTFKSDGSGSNFRFNATYEPYRYHRILSSESGWFSLKDGPLDYTPKFNRSWLINATRPIILSSNRIVIFHNEELTIYDGPTTSSALLLNSSLTSLLPSLLTSSANQMLIVFTSSQLLSISMFNITYYASECQHYLDSESGWFSSPNHPLNYTGNNSCRWYFNTKKPIIFSFHHFHLENKKDGLMIYDGSTESSDLLFKGSSSSNNKIPSSIETTSNQALVVFSSDKSGPFSGFNATYEVQKKYTIFRVFDSNPFRCQFILSSKSGGFRSPKFLKSNRVVNCQWIINTTQPTLISFSSFQLRKGYDLFKIYDGPTNSSTRLLRTSTTVNSPILSTNYPILVTFTSALTSENNGFVANFSECLVLSRNSGWITSPNYPEKYPNNVICCWLIQTTVPLKFSTNTFDTEDYSDWLKIYDGPSLSSKLLKSAAGYDRFSVTSTASRILVTFTSDSTFTRSGFNLTYSAK